MIKVFQHRQRLLDNFVGFFTFDVNHETNSASIVFELRIVKALLRRQSGKGHNLHLCFVTIKLPAIKLATKNHFQPKALTKRKSLAV